MWIDYFQYEYCIADDLLFIKGYAENENKKLNETVAWMHQTIWDLVKKGERQKKQTKP